MNDAALFSPADIRVIRNYVQTKYAQLSGEKQTEIVASAVKTTVQRRMPALPADLQSRMADKLIRRCLVAERRAIVPVDVLDACASVALPDPQMKALVASSILRWIQELEPGQWDEDKLAARMGITMVNQDSSAGTRTALSDPGARPEQVTNTGGAGDDGQAVQITAVDGGERSAHDRSADGAGDDGQAVQITAVDESERPQQAAVGACALSESMGNEAAEALQGPVRLATDDNSHATLALAADDLANVQRRYTGVAAVPKFVWALAIMLLFGGITAAAMAERQPAPEPVHSVAPTFTPPPVTPAPEPDVGMPAMLRFQEIDEEAIQSYLNSRDSMLAQEPYFSAIVDSGREHDVHPLLLFAITGQEQGFVPKTNKHAERIANNPFNVFQSWERFNTNIQESADIAARTVSRQGAKRPEGFDPFAWLNETYAEDPNWAQGVKLIFHKLNSLDSGSAQAMSTE